MWRSSALRCWHARSGVRSDVAVILGGIAYALSPRMLTVLGAISIEAWPSALAPWVLLPLVIGSSRGSPRRAAALSAVAVAMVGGVNAAATFSVIPLGAVWLLTRTAGPRRRRMMLWWPVFVLVGTLWWLVPLFVLGAYSPPFLDFIESAANTTFSTTLFDSLRGTSDWVPYVDLSAKAGNDLIRLFHLPVLSGVVLLLGVVGLLHRRNEHRQFLALGLAVGMLMVTAGHTGVVQGWGAAEVQSLLDGVLAPLRNVHKFDPIIRLPLVLGLAWTVDQAWRSLRSRRVQKSDREEQARRLRLRVLVGTAVIAVLGASMPAYTGRITPNGFLSIPEYWQETADWLESRSDDGQALLAPGSSFGVYAWGNPRDEPMQFLAQSRWAVRNAVPLTPPGNIRMLDAVERLFAQGLGSDGLAPYLRRAGIGYLVVRNDLAKLPDNPDSVLVHQALRDSPGLTRVATFGPDVGGEAHLDTKNQRVLINSGWQSEYPAVEIFEVEGDAGFATETGAPTRVVGGPEDLLDLADLGVARGRADRAGQRRRRTESTDGAVVLTDGQRSIERSFGRVHDGASETRASRPDAAPGQPHVGLPVAALGPLVDHGLRRGGRVGHGVLVHVRRVRGRDQPARAAAVRRHRRSWRDAVEGQLPSRPASAGGASTWRSHGPSTGSGSRPVPRSARWCASGPSTHAPRWWPSNPGPRARSGSATTRPATCGSRTPRAGPPTG